MTKISVTITSSSSSSFCVVSLASIDLFRPRLMVSSKVFKVVFVHLVSHISALFLASCCCSFLLQVVASLICILLVSRQPFLLSTLPTFLHSFCGQKGAHLSSSKKIPSWLMSIALYPFFRMIQISFPYKRTGAASARGSEVYSHLNHILTCP